MTGRRAADVGAATTTARRSADGTWRLWGDKWFCSNANADVALTLARPEGAPPGTRGLGMFLVPKHLPDGTKNGWVINRLKDKFGSRSMASGEVTYQGAVAHVVGDIGRRLQADDGDGQPSRLSNATRRGNHEAGVLSSRSSMQRGRAGLGGPLIALPLLRANLMEMLLDVEAAARSSSTPRPVSTAGTVARPRTASSSASDADRQVLDHGAGAGSGK
jgi:alkylation response protein AidB-like acyl-CoA dehydrogenase